jgi:hypothetical protein
MTIFHKSSVLYADSLTTDMAIGGEKFYTKIIIIFICNWFVLFLMYLNYHNIV